jgi:anti-sigma B factor antagonist
LRDVYAVSERSETDPPRPDGLELVERVIDDALVITAVGEIDLDTAPALGAAVIDCVDKTRGGRRILDLSSVTFLNSTGLTALLRATNHAEAQRELLPIVVDGNRPVIRPVQVTGLDDVLTLYHTVDEALHARNS